MLFGECSTQEDNRCDPGRSDSLPCIDSSQVIRHSLFTAPLSRAGVAWPCCSCRRCRCRGLGGIVRASSPWWDGRGESTGWKHGERERNTLQGWIAPTVSSFLPVHAQRFASLACARVLFALSASSCVCVCVSLSPYLSELVASPLVFVQAVIAYLLLVLGSFPRVFPFRPLLLAKQCRRRS